MFNRNEALCRAEELNAEAAKLMPLPDGLSQPEQLLYMSLRILYRDYRSEKIAASDAKAEKTNLSPLI